MTDDRAVHVLLEEVGVIIDQSPTAFTEMVPGSEVIVTVGEAGPPPD